MYDSAIKELVTAFNVGFLATDRWESRYVTQQAEADFNKYRGSFGVKSYSMKLSDFIELKDWFLLEDTNKFILPSLEIPKEEIDSYSVDTDYREKFYKKPAAHLYLQICTVREVGGNIDKGEKLTDDIFRSLMLGLKFVTDETIRRRYLVPMRTSEGIVSREIASADSDIVARANQANQRGGNGYATQ
jgi:hypothetical protein